MTDIKTVDTEQKTIVFQGSEGAYAQYASQQTYPGMKPIGRTRYEDVFNAVRDGLADYAIIPIDNSAAGRVADIHHMLPNSKLHIIAEHFLEIEHCLYAKPGVSLDQIKMVHSHEQSLRQCAGKLAELGLTPVCRADSAGAAYELAHDYFDPQQAAQVGVIASPLVADLYGLTCLKSRLQDQEQNITRYLILAKDPLDAVPVGQPALTTFVFRVRNIPSALYKSLGGFATNGINLTKLESYMMSGDVAATQFYCDAEGQPDQRELRLAMEELGFFARDVRILGVYPAHPYRRQQSQPTALHALAR